MVKSSWRVAGAIPEEVNELFNLLNLPAALWLCGRLRGGSQESEDLDVSQLYGPLEPIRGIILHLSPTHRWMIN